MNFSNSGVRSNKTVKFYAVIWPCNKWTNDSVTQATTTNITSLFTINIVFRLMWDWAITDAFDSNVSFCSFKKADGNIHGLRCLWIQINQELLGQIQIKAKLNMTTDNSERKLSDHSYLGIRTVVYTVVDAALQGAL